MDGFVEYASNLRERLTVLAQSTGLTYEQLETAGIAAIAKAMEVNSGLEKLDVADTLEGQTFYLPKDVLRSMCLCAAYLGLAMGRYRDQNTNAPILLAEAAEELGFVMGAAFGIDFEGAVKRAELSKLGSKGALARHKSTSVFKQWAVSEAVKLRGSQKDIARMLAAKIPQHLTEVSKDPQRLIYDTLRAVKKSQ